MSIAEAARDQAFPAFEAPGGTMGLSTEGPAGYALRQGLMANVGIPDGGSSGSGRPGNGSTLAGVALVLAGAALVYMGIVSVTATVAKGSVSAPIVTASSAPCPPTVATTAAVVAPTGTAAKTASAAVVASGSAAPAVSGSAAPVASGAAPATGEAPQLVIHFVKKEVIPQKEDIAKLAAIGAKLARRDGVKIVLEGYGDDPGTDEATRGLGRRRGTVLKRTLGDVGVLGERVTVTPIDVADAADGAGTVRLRTVPPLPEAELK